METALIIGFIVLTGLVISAYILVLGDKEKNEVTVEKKDESVILTPVYNFGPTPEMSEDEEDKMREEAEKDYVTPNPVYDEPEIDLSKLEIYLDTAKNRQLPRCIRLIAGMYLKEYSALAFMEDMLRKMEPDDSESVFDAMEMGRNPELYMERHKECEAKCSNRNCPYHVVKSRKAAVPLILLGLLCTGSALAVGSGLNGITQATSEVTSYFNPITKLIYAVGAIVGIIGAIRVYSKFSSGDPDTTKVAATWFGACIFLVISATVLSGFFF